MGTRSHFTRLVVASAVAMALHADVILDWNDLMLDAIRVDNSSPTLSSRNLAILHTAIYDAVNSVVRTHQPYRFQLAAPGDTLPEAAAVAAAREVMNVLYPTFQARSKELYQDYLASVPASDALDHGLTLGGEVGRRALESRHDDKANTQVPYIPSKEPGQWQRTPPFFRPPLTPQWRHVRPFCLPVVEPFVPGPPPALDSAEYAAALNEVKAIGGKVSSIRTEYQRETAVFWSDFSYTAMPPGHWHEIAATIARNQGNTLAENARIFALISLAQADAAIVCWEAKYRYNLWRPITAIQQAARDANPATEPDAEWNHLLPAPQFPAYPSGHSTFSKASAQVLTQFHGTDELTFVTGSDALPGVFRTFHSLAACADEVGLSRIYGGIHFSFDNELGKASGAKIADYIMANCLLPNEALPLVRVDSFTVTNGAPRLLLHGHPDTELVLETSADRSRWTPLATNRAVTGGVAVTLPAGEAARFLRLRER